MAGGVPRCEHDPGRRQRFVQHAAAAHVHTTPRTTPRTRPRVHTATHHNVPPRRHCVRPNLNYFHQPAAITRNTVSNQVQLPQTRRQTPGTCMHARRLNISAPMKLPAPCTASAAGASYGAPARHPRLPACNLSGRPPCFCCHHARPLAAATPPLWQPPPLKIHKPYRIVKSMGRGKAPDVISRGSKGQVIFWQTALKLRSHHDKHS